MAKCVEDRLSKLVSLPHDILIQSFPTTLTALTPGTVDDHSRIRFECLVRHVQTTTHLPLQIHMQ
jgi:hypothetical protein